MFGTEQSLLDDFDLVGGYSPGIGRRLKRASYTRDRLWLLGLGWGTIGGRIDPPPVIPPTYQITLTAKPAVVFRPRKLVIQVARAEDYEYELNPDPAGDLIVRDIKIAAQSQFADPGGDPGNAPYHGGYSGNGYPVAGFRFDANDSLFKFDTCPAGREISIIIAGDDGDIIPHNFWYVTAGMLGYSAARE